ncbi:hypothetical protein HYU20_03725 [Candidatus Woesearchaeota archaeon]|nr:hypothetical protein [Candidatus Woesearchaeota archaeon]
MVNVNKVLPVLLVALILVSAVQAFQLNTLKEKLEGGKLSVSSGSSAPKSTSAGASGTGGVLDGSGSGASGIADLPSMVGGC